MVAGNMYAKGAATWIKPSLANIARFTKGGNLFGMAAAEYDRHILDQVIDRIAEEGLPEVLTLYIMGLDHESHHHGPEAQIDYLIGVVDPIVGELWDFILDRERKSALPLIAIFSDHGQIQVVPDDRHSLRLAFPFEREIGHLFDALGLDVHDYPGEEPTAINPLGSQPCSLNQASLSITPGAGKVYPPSITMTWPRIISASGVHRKATRLATSFGVTRRPAGVRDIARSTRWSSFFTASKCCKASVSTTPGETALTAIFLDASSIAR
jgi:hypothetical protein